MNQKQKHVHDHSRATQYARTAELFIFTYFHIDLIFLLFVD